MAAPLPLLLSCSTLGITLLLPDFKVTPKALGFAAGAGAD
jgi:hypothetical protein